MLVLSAKCLTITGTDMDIVDVSIVVYRTPLVAAKANIITIADNFHLLARMVTARTRTVLAAVHLNANAEEVTERSVLDPRTTVMKIGETVVIAKGVTSMMVGLDAADATVMILSYLRIALLSIAPVLIDINTPLQTTTLILTKVMRATATPTEER